ncbi:MAG TPA: dihydroorotate dehydrogenase-like protein [Bryobacteraceae bacterium]
MDLSTTYLGMKLPHPLMAGASPLADELDAVKQLEDAGSAAIVLRSLFEEQIVAEEMADLVYQDGNSESSAEAASYFPDAGMFVLGPDEYLNHLRRVKESVNIPVIASLNGATAGGWLSYGRLLEEAGADALELNVYHGVLDPRKSGGEIERETIAMVREMKRQVKIPVAVKLAPFFTAFAHFVTQIDEEGADGLVLFNRYYGTDIDVQELLVTRTLHLSDSSELLLRLRAIAAVAPLVRGSIAVTGGVHTAIDAVKSVMAGAHATQMVSALLKHGPGHLRNVRRDLENWMEENEWSSLAEMRGNMAVDKAPNPEVYERSNYMMLLQNRNHFQERRNAAGNY